MSNQGRMHLNVSEASQDNVELQEDRKAKKLDELYEQPSHNTDVSVSRGHEVRKVLAKNF